MFTLQLLKEVMPTTNALSEQIWQAVFVVSIALEQE